MYMIQELKGKKLQKTLKPHTLLEFKYLQHKTSSVYND